MLWSMAEIDWPIKNDKITYDNIRNIAACQGQVKLIGQVNCNIFKQATKIRCFPKSNTAH